jgi:hypothetical protein
MDFSNMLQYLQGLLTNKQTFNQNAFGQEMGLAQTQAGNQNTQAQAAAKLAQDQLAAQIAQQQQANQLATTGQSEQYGLAQTAQQQEAQKLAADIAAQQAATGMAQTGQSEQYGLQKGAQDFGQAQTKLQESPYFLQLMQALGSMTGAGGTAASTGMGKTIPALSAAPKVTSRFIPDMSGGAISQSAPVNSGWTW